MKKKDLRAHLGCSALGVMAADDSDEIDDGTGMFVRLILSRFDASGHALWERAGPVLLTLDRPETAALSASQSTETEA